MIYRTRDAVNAILPNADCRIEEEKITIWREDSTEPTQIEIDAKLAELQAEWTAQEYARNREAEYDALNQFEMQFDDKEDGTTTWEDAIKAIKMKWPKDNSGPKPE